MTMHGFWKKNSQGVISGRPEQPPNPRDWIITKIADISRDLQTADQYLTNFIARPPSDFILPESGVRLLAFNLVIAGLEPINTKIIILRSFRYFSG